MLKLTEILPQDSKADDKVTLTYEARQKSRLLSETERGVKIGLFLPRGRNLRRGLVLTGSDDYRVFVEAAAESLSVARAEDNLQFARACYHIGNRHVALQILPNNELRLLTDHILDQMLANLGLSVIHKVLPFEPEQGAYHGHGH
jgi:urease accessory protein